MTFPLALALGVALLAPTFTAGQVTDAGAVEAGDANALQSELAERPSAAGYYDLALAYRERGLLGEAAWALASAEALGASGEAERLGRDLAAGLPPDLRPLSESAFTAAWRGLATWPPDNGWALAAMILSVLGGLALGARSAKVVEQRRGRLAVAGIGAWLLAIASVALASTRSRMRTTPVIAVVEATGLYAAPSERSELLRRVPEGVVVRAEELLDGAWAVTLPTGEAGWLPATAVRRVLSKD